MNQSSRTENYKVGSTLELKLNLVTPGYQFATRDDSSLPRNYQYIIGATTII